MSSTFPTLISLNPGVRVLIAGGAGTVGSGVTLAALKQGAKVTVATRSPDSFQTLRRAIPDQFHRALSVIFGDLRTEQGAKKVFEEAIQTSNERIQHVVASMRTNKSWWKVGHLVDQSLKEFQNVAHEEVTPHFLLMKAFLPYLVSRKGSTYTVVTGYPGSTNPAPNSPSSRLCVAGGTLHGLVNGARAEFDQSKVAVSEVHLKCLVHNVADIEIGSMGPQELGNDLVGTALTAVIASGIRGQVVIRSRDQAKSWAGSRQVYVMKSILEQSPDVSA